MTTVAPVPERSLTPWRPVQFLGSKLRSLDFVASEVGALSDTSERVWEPFTGSSVVSQRLAMEGHQVWATDALHSSVAFSSALLGVGHRGTAAGSLTEAARAATRRGIATGHWADWVEREKAALEDGDGAALLACGRALPQRWRPAPQSERLRIAFAEVEDAAKLGQTRHDGLVSTVYAGTYFGIAQALALEQIRSQIDVLAPSTDPDSAWVRAGLITALCSAASAAVFSAGKHFAQPHRVRDGKDLTFHAGRALRDRSIDIARVFNVAAQEIDDRVNDSPLNHDAGRLEAESVSADDLSRRRITTVYADPPYTAQQYSRFYHVLEVLTSGVPVQLQRVSGAVTTGLYPDNKYLSPFSSKTLAPGAFRQLLSTTRDADAHMVLSYSDTRGATTGNSRMVSLASLVEWMQRYYGKNAVTVRELNLKYRQFNNTKSGVVERHDPEFILVGRAHAG